MARYSESQNKATQKYISENYDQIIVRVKKGEREKYKRIAEEKNTSLNKLIVDFLRNLETVQSMSRRGDLNMTKSMQEDFLTILSERELTKEFEVKGYKDDLLHIIDMLDFELEYMLPNVYQDLDEDGEVRVIFGTKEEQELQLNEEIEGEFLYYSDMTAYRYNLNEEKTLSYYGREYMKITINYDVPFSFSYVAPKSGKNKLITYVYIPFQYIIK